METKQLILIDQFCTHYNVEPAFLESLQESGLVEVIVLDEIKYLAHEQLRDVEKMIRLHDELGINIEGIDAVLSLLERIDRMQQELIATQNRLRMFE